MFLPVIKKSLIAQAYDKLMVVGGLLADFDVEVVDLSGNFQTCVKPADYPDRYYLVGTYFQNKPTVCGGGPVCYQYDMTVSLL